MLNNHYHVRIVWRSSNRREPISVILDKDYYSIYSSPLSFLYSWSEFFYSKAFDYSCFSGKLILTVTDLESKDKLVCTIFNN